jgi:hypothetical protein
MFQKAGYQTGQFCGIRDWKSEGNQVVGKDKVVKPAEGAIQPKPKDKSN